MNKIAIDIHGVINKDPEFFKRLSEIINKIKGVELHIVTGSELYEVKDKLKDWGIIYDKFFSIVGYHKSIDTPITYNSKGQVYLDDYLWDKTKGDYCKAMGIDIIIDDTLRYAKYMPSHTHFHLYK